jgi:plasmid stability protein
VTDFSDDPFRLEQLLDKLTRSMRSRIIRAVNRITSPQRMERLARLLAEGREEEAVRMADELAQEVGAAGAKTYTSAGEATSIWLGNTARVIVAFDAANPRALAWLEQQRFDLVQSITAEQREILRSTLLEGSRSGINPREQAKRLGDSLGLTRQQQAAVANYRRLLEQGSRRALARRLHDDRVKDVRNLTPAQIDRLVASYRAKMLRYRAEVVARTESLRAVNSGVSEMFRQAEDTGLIEELSQKWHTARDARVRGHHRSMHGQIREIGVPFISGQGNRLLYPGDPSAPASDVVQCRCVVLTRFAVDQ